MINTKKYPLQILLVPFIFMVMSFTAFPQESKTLLNGKDVSHGSYGAPAISFSNIGDEFALLIGGRGGWILNFESKNSFSFGAAGYGLANNIETSSSSDLESSYLYLGYGGLETEFTHRTNDLIHTTFRGLIGSGVTGNRSEKHQIENLFGREFFVAEPGLNVELNVTDFFRINTGISYRFISGSEHQDFSDGDLSGISGVLSFKFGWF